jgi:hypothetical protein
MTTIRHALLALLLLPALAHGWTTAKGYSDGAAPRFLAIPAGGCQGTTAISNWDLPTTTPAVAVCVTGTNIQKGALQYADTTGGFSAQMTLPISADWSSTVLPNVAIYWTTPAITGNAKWTVAFVCTAVAATATDDPAFPTTGAGFNTVTTAAPGTPSQIQTSLITAATLPASCVTGTAELLHIRVFRDGNDAADTITNSANFIAMQLTVFQGQ